MRLLRMPLPALWLGATVMLIANHPIAYAGEGEAKPGASGAVYLRLKPITFSVIGPDDRIDRQIGIVMQIQLAAGKTPQQAEPFRRQIEDRFLVALTELWDQRPPDAPPLAAETIKTRLMKVASDITGPDMIDSVYIQELSERRR